MKLIPKQTIIGRALEAIGYLDDQLLPTDAYVNIRDAHGTWSFTRVPWLTHATRHAIAAEIISCSDASDFMVAAGTAAEWTPQLVDEAAILLENDIEAAAKRFLHRDIIATADSDLELLQLLNDHAAGCHVYHLACMISDLEEAENA